MILAIEPEALVAAFALRDLMEGGKTLENGNNHERRNKGAASSFMQSQSRNTMRLRLQHRSSK
jgi:hypothetical protein